tara:strand:+ start:888 stop:1112 length:225 start_codon:yes stop_codon:yes gene_type:complete
MNNNTKRKRGRPAGSTSFIRVKLTDLVGHLGSNGNVVVSKKWLEDIGFNAEPPPIEILRPVKDPVDNKIQFTVE